jgi:hypothetical protein
MAVSFCFGLILSRVVVRLPEFDPNIGAVLEGFTIQMVFPHGFGNGIFDGLPDKGISGSPCPAPTGN